MKFKPDTTIVIETNKGEVTTEGQRVKHGLVLHRTLNQSWGYTITDPVSSGIVASGDTPGEALENLEKVIKLNGGGGFAEKLEQAREKHKRCKKVFFEAAELLRPVVEERDAAYVLRSIAYILFPNVRIESMRAGISVSNTTHH